MEHVLSHDVQNEPELNYFWNFLILDYFYNTYDEGDETSLSCDSEIQSGLVSYSDYIKPVSPYIIIDAVRYTYYDCDHTETFGVKDMCENKTECTFDVTNANIGSSCGVDTGVGGLFITWHCVRK